MLRPWQLEVQLIRNNDKAIYLQIAEVIICDIKSGRLKPGTALPGTRKLAEAIQVNRNTIVQAIDYLLIQGWLQTEARRGTFVKERNLEFELRQDTSEEQTTGKSKQPVPFIRFDDGNPDSKMAPIEELGRAYRQLFKRKAKWKLMGYSQELGDQDFRQAIVAMLNQQRAMQLDAQHICITRGSQMAMYLIAQCLLKKGDVIAIESPGYHSAWKVFEHAQASLLPIPVDQHGLMVDELELQLQINPQIKAIYLTPHRQYPTTVSLSTQRRSKLIQLSNHYGFTIIEDDYDYEFHFGRLPKLPISSSPSLRRFIYVGTFSKVVAPALRIGYLATTDKKLLQQIVDLRKIIDLQGDTMMEQAVLELINDGTIKRHMREASLHYQQKRDYIGQLIQQYLENWIAFENPEGGLALWITGKQVIDWNLLAKRMLEKGIEIRPSDHYSFDQPVNGIRLGYGSLDFEQLEIGIRTMAEILEKMLPIEGKK